MPLSAEDLTAIQQLLACHLHHYDRRDPAPVADTFTEDGVVELGRSRHEGRSAIEALIGEFRERFGPDRFRHWVNNVWIEGDGNDATLRCYLAVFDNEGDGRVTLLGQRRPPPPRRRRVEVQPQPLRARVPRRPSRASTPLPRCARRFPFTECDAAQRQSTCHHQPLRQCRSGTSTASAPPSPI